MMEERRGAGALSLHVVVDDLGPHAGRVDLDLAAQVHGHDIRRRTAGAGLQPGSSPGQAFSTRSLSAA